ncbi:hypothetical protein PG997_011894 [Apiospora hydei]|uniref:Uncharacterized protein n=1 Tax=Apiospora hydei TaxID=1337664 RepID=A0ABR1V1S1_9PEZI
MDTESADAEIETWLGAGLMVPSRIMERLDAAVADGHPLDNEEKLQLRQTFSAMEWQTLEETAEILFRCLWYLSTIPFPSAPETQVPPGLTLTQTTRALAWFLPGRHIVITRGGNLSRSRTEADHRRLLFQSLATATLGTPAEELESDAALDRAARNAIEDPSPYQNWPVINHDGDGDEIFHDLLEVLYATQPRGPIWLAPVGMDGFRWVAKGIVAQLPPSSSSSTNVMNNLPSLYSLAIPKARLVAIIRLALAASFLVEEYEEYMDMDEGEEDYQPKPVAQLKLSEVDDAAVECAAAPFCEQDEGTGLVSWPMFDDALRENVS